MRRYVEESIFGASDGMLAAIALVLATESRGRKAVLLALFAVFVAEALGMAVGDFLSKEKASVGWRQALVMGTATGISIALVALPWLVIPAVGTAEFGSIVVALLIGAAIAQMRKGGWANWSQTFGLLAAVAAITGVVGHA